MHLLLQKGYKIIIMIENIFYGIIIIGGCIFGIWLSCLDVEDMVDNQEEPYDDNF